MTSIDYRGAEAILELLGGPGQHPDLPPRSLWQRLMTIGLPPTQLTVRVLAMVEPSALLSHERETVCSVCREVAVAEMVVHATESVDRRLLALLRDPLIRQHVTTRFMREYWAYHDDPDVELGPRAVVVVAQALHAGAICSSTWPGYSAFAQFIPAAEAWLVSEDNRFPAPPFTLAGRWRWLTSGAQIHAVLRELGGAAPFELWWEQASLAGGNLFIAADDRSNLWTFYRMTPGET